MTCLRPACIPGDPVARSHLVPMDMQLSMAAATQYHLFVLNLSYNQKILLCWHLLRVTMCTKHMQGLTLILP